MMTEIKGDVTEEKRQEMIDTLHEELKEVNEKYFKYIRWGMLGRPEILILDDATSALDLATEARLQTALREAMKENGIGRPSTRAAIIKTLFSREYIRLQRKSIFATERGVQLIGLIKEELLKSAELTGRWEKKLREIERQEYDAKQFIDELKVMVTDIVRQVLSDNTNRLTAMATPAPDALAHLKAKADKKEQQERAAQQPTEKKRKIIREGSVCPVCGEGKVIKGKTAYGCSRWKEGCDFRKPFK